MKRVVLIRPNGSSESRIAKALFRKPIDGYDVCHPDRFRIQKLDTMGANSVTLGGQPLSSFDRIILLGPPNYECGWMPEADQRFVENEIAAAMASVLHKVRDKVFHIGATYFGPRLLLSKSAQVRVLASLGWRTPVVSDVYDFPSARVTKERFPSPDLFPTSFNVITSKRSFSLPVTKTLIAQPERLAAEIAATQSYLKSNQIGWLTIPCVTSNEGVCAYGMSASLPSQVNETLLDEMIDDLLW